MQRSIPSEHPVTRDDQRDRVSANGLTHGPRRLGATHDPRQIPIAGGLSGPHLKQGLVDRAMKRGSREPKVDGDIQAQRLTVEIARKRLEPAAKGPQRKMGRHRLAAIGNGDGRFEQLLAQRTWVSGQCFRKRCEGKLAQAERARYPT